MAVKDLMTTALAATTAKPRAIISIHANFIWFAVLSDRSDRVEVAGQTGWRLPVTRCLGRVFAVMDRESAWG
uniref:Uncharacterized protein n=1 Tax=Oryza sativa subsp. japonica TaxID=39947 RepID=Q84YU3_ORYSJ|nr:hypothetical protein [Oryza sativa Japonica Group]